jgi:hypothetical protein
MRVQIVHGNYAGRIEEQETTEAECNLATGYAVLADETAAAAGPAVTVTGIAPISATVGGPDVTLHVYGTGFTAETVILFNLGEEPTTYLDSTEVTTLVKPSTASGPATVPVSVVGAAATVPFSFEAAVTRTRSAPTPTPAPAPAPAPPKPPEPR